MFRHGVALGVVVATVAYAGSARADVEANLRLGAEALFYRSIPTLTLPEPVFTAARGEREGQVAMEGGLRAVGLVADSGLVVDRRIAIPMIGMGVATAVLGHSAVRSSLDGSIVTARPWEALIADLRLPGIGVRSTVRRWFFEANVRAAVAFIKVPIWVSDGAETSSTQGTVVMPAARAEVTVCRRLDPENKMCATLIPKIYEGAFMNGGSVTLTWHWGL